MYLGEIEVQVKFQMVATEMLVAGRLDLSHGPPPFRKLNAQCAHVLASSSRADYPNRSSIRDTDKIQARNANCTSTTLDRNHPPCLRARHEHASFARYS